MLLLSRSLLFVPANKEKMLRKVNQLQSDIILLDLEDAVDVDDKQASRELIHIYIGQWTKPIFIRINSIDSGVFEDDMRFIHQIGDANALRGIVLPEADSKKAVETLASYLDDAERYHNRPNTLTIMPLVENALGIHNLNDIIAASPRIEKIAFGGEDFTHDIGGQTTPTGNELLYARSKIVLASRVHEIEAPIDTIYTDLHDSAGFERNCQFVKSLGFGGKLLIHPNQIDVTNTTFAPSEAEVEFAQKVLYQSKEHKGAFRLDGKMIDKPIIEKAKKVINDAKIIQSN